MPLLHKNYNKQIQITHKSCVAQASLIILLVAVAGRIHRCIADQPTAPVFSQPVDYKRVGVILYC